MPRTPRADGTDAVHHVFGRGLSQRAVFEGAGDRRCFLALLAGEHRKGRLRVLAYCLMGNHYHLMVGSPKGQLSGAMQYVLNVYVRRFNRLRGRDGPLFRTRFESRPVHSHAYQEALLRYIDANPVAAGIVARSWLYEGGSARHYVSLRRPPWLEAAWVDSILGGPRPEERLTRYAEWSGHALPAWARGLVVERMTRGAPRTGELDLLARETQAHVDSWLLGNAALGDGSTPRGVQVPAFLVERAMAGVPPRERLGLRVGLLRQLAGATIAEVRNRTGVSLGRLYRELHQYSRRLEADAEFRAGVAAIVHAVVRDLRGTT